MRIPTGTTVPGRAGRLTASRISGIRRASFAAFVMLVAQFALGIYVNLYVTVPSVDHGHGLGQAIANGPAGLTLHIVLGLLLILAALGFLVQAILVRRPGAGGRLMQGMTHRALAGTARGSDDYLRQQSLPGRLARGPASWDDLAGRGVWGGGPWNNARL